MPEQVQYQNVTHYHFNFSVTESNATWITVYPLEIPVYAPLSVMVDVVLSQGQNLNLTGSVDVNGYFIVSNVNKAGEGGNEWIETLKSLWALIGNIGKTLVTLIVQVIETFSGYKLPTWTVSLILVAVLVSLFITLGKKLPLILLIIMFLVCAALISHLISTLQLQIQYPF